MKQISDSGVAERAGCSGAGVMGPSGFVKLGCAECETCGAIAAPTAALVPILSALRRVIFSVIGLGKPYSPGSSQPPAFLWRARARAQTVWRHSVGRGRNRAFRRPSRQLSPALL